MKYVICHGFVYDGSEDFTWKEKNIYIKDENIEALTDWPVILPGYDIIEARGQYILPGLINMHAHLFGSGKPSKSLSGGPVQDFLMKLLHTPAGKPIIMKLVKNSVESSLYSGCTTERTMGDFIWSDMEIRNRISNGRQNGPRLLVSGPAITVIDGHGHGTISLTANETEKLVEYTKNVIDHKPDWIKICVTGGVMDAKVKGEPGVVKMNSEQVSAITGLAHSYGYKVASHTESLDGIKVALQNGVDTIEHGAQLDKEAIELFKQTKAAFITTLSPAVPLAYLEPEITMMNDLCVYNSNVLLKNMIEGTKTALKEGIPVGMGTDCSCPFSTPYAMPREIEFFVRYIGVSNAQAVYIATNQNAKILGLQHRIGQILPNYSADLIVCNNNPFEDIRALRVLEDVYKEGKRYHKPNPRKNQWMEDILDKINR
ncbi:MAG: amidohydrolase family protein [Erysipelotrichaceae bacterium]|nr:amidohydrolase family protein [Erysipelotrichaceae bacterium]